VRIALAHKGLDYEYRAVHLLQDGGVQNTDEYRAKNPGRTVPLLELTDGGKVRRIAQSLAIIEYLEETHPTPPLLPKDPYERAVVRELAQLVNSGVQPLQNLAVLQHLKRDLGADDKAWARHWVARGMDALEARVATTSGRYCVGDSVSLADVCLAPQLYSSRRFGLDVGQWPTLARVEAALNELPAFQKAHAERQPDAQPG
jgi:maleylpyruvate isomerase